MMYNFRYRGVKLFCFILVTLSLFWGCVKIIFMGNEDDIDTKWYLRKAPCELSKDNLKSMVDLTYLLHDVLDTLKVAHVLCFGTLWGALRSGTVLKWDNNVDICATNSQIKNMDESKFISLLKDKNAEVQYNSKYGFYKVTYEGVAGYINIFQLDVKTIPLLGGDSLAYQIGWGRWSLFNKQKKVTVPLRLLEHPFPKVKFYDQEMPVPHEDIEILKHLYPDNWWMEIKPLGC